MIDDTQEQPGGLADSADTLEFREFYREHRAYVQQIVFVQTSRGADYEGLTDEVFTRAAVFGHKRIQEPRSWLRATAMNLIRDDHRTSTRMKRGGTTQTNAVEELPDEAVWRSVTNLVGPEAAHDVQEALQLLRQLRPRPRYALWLSSYEQMKNTDIAREMGCSGSMVARYLREAEAHLAPVRESRTQRAQSVSSMEGRTV